MSLSPRSTQSGSTHSSGSTGSTGPVRINHLILSAEDNLAAATWFAEVMGLDEPVVWNWFATVQLGDGEHIEFANAPVEPLHVAFLVDEPRFDEIYARLLERDVEHFADPGRRRPGEYNTNHGGRGVYFRDLSGHFLEVITAPYAD